VTNAFCTKVGTKVCTCNVGFEVSIGACTAVSGNESIVINFINNILNPIHVNRIVFYMLDIFPLGRTSNNTYIHVIYVSIAYLMNT